MKKIKIAFILIVVLIFIIPGIKFNFKINSISEIDNRYLSEIPLGSEQVDFTKAWETYINDRIGFRNESIDLYTKLSDKLFNIMIHPSYEYGQDGYVFFKLASPQEDYSFLDTYVKFIKKMQIYCQARGVPFIYVIDPSKTTVYSQYLPKGYHYQNKRLNYLRNKLEESEIPYVDNADYLTKKSKDNIQVFNKKYNAGHWNDLGAFYGMEHILKKLHTFWPDTEMLKLNDFNIDSKIETTLPVSKFKIEEEVPILTFTKPLPKSASYKYINEILLNENFKEFYRYENYSDAYLNKNVLVFQGSYFIGNQNIISPIFQTYTGIHAYQNIVNFDYYFNIFQPECVIFESAEYATTESYYNSNNMQNKVFNPVMNTQDCETINANIETKENNNLMLIKVNMDKVQYAYIQLQGKVYDLIWNSEMKVYEASVDKINYKGEPIIYIKK